MSELDYELYPSSNVEPELLSEVPDDAEQKALIGETHGSEKIDLGPDEACGVSFLIYAPPDTDTLGDEITGSLSVTAGEAVD